MPPRKEEGEEVADIHGEKKKTLAYVSKREKEMRE